MIRRREESLLDLVVPILMIVMGVAISGVWTRDIFVGDQIDRSRGLLGAREPDGGYLLVPHWIAEYSTALLLFIGAAGLLADVR